MLYPFSALLARMKYITRWSLMHSTRAESLSEHTCDTALLAHMLCLIARRYTGTPCRPKTVAVAALYHDAPEIITGDMPTPVKYSSPTLRDAYKALETESVHCMTGLLPDELSEELSPFISGELLTAEEKRLLKAADRLSALIKCMEEQRSGAWIVCNPSSIQRNLSGYSPFNFASRASTSGPRQSGLVAMEMPQTLGWLRAERYTSSR